MSLCLTLLLASLVRDGLGVFEDPHIGPHGLGVRRQMTQEPKRTIEQRIESLISHKPFVVGGAFGRCQNKHVAELPARLN